MNTSSHSSRQLLGRALLSLTLLGATSVAQAQHRPEPGPRMAAMHEEPMRAPLGYTRLQRPQEIERERPHFGDQYRHNFRADRALRIGPYHPPIGYQYRRWHYGEILPRPFWGNDYLLSDFWLFDLDFPPAGYEWVRYGPDALLIDIGSGEVVQAVYGRFL